ncbi:right-handed parallel beta-helix repeat-containing protein [Arenicella sp. 4NH20-0111]|uniref:right-handed parallel beta-helix repeat-containing protein n=1 Tax=Arenicella sp. 4NH20-0111 TaxID=3127648 RepID=UPI00333F8FA1
MKQLYSSKMMMATALSVFASTLSASEQVKNAKDAAPENDEQLLYMVPAIVSAKQRTPIDGSSTSAVPISQSKPGPENTGPAGVLTPHDGTIKVTENGALIENLSIQGCIQIEASDVTIRNVRIDCSGLYAIRVDDDVSNVLVEDTEMFNMTSSGVLGSNFTLRRVNIHDSGGDAVKPSRNVLIEQSWFHRLGSKVGSHSDGVQMVSGGNVIVRGNNIDMPPLTGFTNSQCLIIQTNFGPIDNVRIEGNWLNGGGWCVQVNDKGQGFGSPTNVTIKNNRFGGDCAFGTILVRGEDADTKVEGNIFEPTGGVIGTDVSTSTCRNDL